MVCMIFEGNTTKNKEEEDYTNWLIDSRKMLIHKLIQWNYVKGTRFFSMFDMILNIWLASYGLS